ncbi:hypothetical protein CAXC1_70020 [Candidatus Xenohaliotis californiensis]|uniref:Uncharacterized protein n=1 Tax=Candidatus Xenohaliotis californiensis TaxID=84677 RepID=A0ABM9N973_9RICK|nr:hypothetical protein CAXC1_70020 [Candidatus Xenohaliotis californiensis]
MYQTQNIQPKIYELETAGKILQLYQRQHAIKGGTLTNDINLIKKKLKSRTNNSIKKYVKQYAANLNIEYQYARKIFIKSAKLLQQYIEQPETTISSIMLTNYMDSFGIEKLQAKKQLLNTCCLLEAEDISMKEDLNEADKAALFIEGWCIEQKIDLEQAKLIYTRSANATYLKPHTDDFAKSLSVWDKIKNFFTIGNSSSYADDPILQKQSWFKKLWNNLFSSDKPYSNQKHKYHTKTTGKLTNNTPTTDKSIPYTDDMEHADSTAKRLDKKMLSKAYSSASKKQHLRQ